MLSVKDLQIAFAGKSVLEGVTFEIAQSAIVGLIGPSGGGKSVLLKIIADVLPADSGSVVLSNAPSISLMFQEGALFDSMSIFENVAFPLVQGQLPIAALDQLEQQRVTQAVSKILAHVGLSKAAHKYPAEISGGMRRRASLARALVSRPDILLLDDPTSGLDPVASSVIMDLIVQLHREYKPTTVIVSHDLRRLLPIVDSTVALFNGRTDFVGPITKIQEQGSSALKEFITCRFDLTNFQQATL